MFEHVVFNEETALWYRHDDHNLMTGITADTYPEAFEMLYGHAVLIPAPVRTPHRASVEA
jgi:hypothetical protein